MCLFVAVCRKPVCCMPESGQGWKDKWVFCGCLSEGRRMPESEQGWNDKCVCCGCLSEGCCLSLSMDGNIIVFVVGVFARSSHA